MQNCGTEHAGLVRSCASPGMLGLTAEVNLWVFTYFLKCLKNSGVINFGIVVIRKSNPFVYIRKSPITCSASLVSVVTVLLSFVGMACSAAMRSDSSYSFSHLLTYRKKRRLPRKFPKFFFLNTCWLEFLWDGAEVRYSRHTSVPECSEVCKAFPAWLHNLPTCCVWNAPVSVALMHTVHAKALENA